MNKQTELQFIPRIGLQNLKQVQTGYICSCPKCSKNSPWKTKLYILTENKSFITVFCQKCGLNTNLKNFIYEYNPSLFEEYKHQELQEKYNTIKTGSIIKKKEIIDSVINTQVKLQYKFELNQKYFKPAANFKNAYNFCKKRKILDHIDKFYYNINPNSILKGMIIFPFLLEDNKTLYGFQGRSCTEKLFHNHLKNEYMKVYNIYNVNLDQTVYIFESIIDSLSIENSIAMMGTSISKPILDMMKNKIFITDNDKVGKKRALEFLDKGYSTLIYPSDFKYKDFNEAICDGMSSVELRWMIKENVYSGLTGITKLKMQLIRSK